MLRMITTLLATILFAMPALAIAVIGQPAPNFTAMDAITGKQVSLGDLKGKVVVLEWHNPYCPFINKFYSVGAMQKMQENAAANDVVWIAINSAAEGKEGYLADAAAANKKLHAAGSHATHYLLDHDGSIGHAYGAKTTPSMFVIAKDGTRADRVAIDSKPTADSADIATATNYVTQALQALENGTPIKTSKTRSYGCFVKY